jgi:hypothetical protein
MCLLKFGKAEFSVAELDGFAKQAGSASVMGYYDVNTLILALDSRGYELSYFDGRKDISELPLEDNDILGVLINTTTPLLFFFTSRHWKCIRKVVNSDNSDASLYFMDSKIKKPKKLDYVQSRAELDDIKNSGGQILIIRKKIH